MSAKRKNARGGKNNKELFIIFFAARVLALLADSLNVQAAVAQANHTQEKKAFFIYLSRDKRLLVSKPKLLMGLMHNYVIQCMRVRLGGIAKQVPPFFRECVFHFYILPTNIPF